MDLAAFGAGFEWGSGVSLPLFSGSVLSSYLIGLSIVGVPARRESPPPVRTPGKSMSIACAVAYLGAPTVLRFCK